MKRTAPVILGALLVAATFTSAQSPAPAGAAGTGTVLVTGSNRGLGFEFVKQYAEQGWSVIATARSPESATELRDLAAKNNKVTIEKLDVLDRPGIKALAAKYRGKPVDLVINNAGVLGDLKEQTLGSLDYAAFEESMAVNVYGALSVSEAFREHVAASRHKKIVAITSGSGIISSRGSGGVYFYKASKVALNMVMHTLAADLRSQGVIVGLVAPGTADTEMRRQFAGAAHAARDQKPAEAVAAMIRVIDGLTMENSDRPLNFDGKVLPW